jgi:two-component system OmpR family sensor kinase
MEIEQALTQERTLEILEGLLRIPAGDLASTLIHASNLIAEATGADKIDAFLYDPSRDSLVAVGTSTQPLSALQRKLGLNVLPLSNGGRSVEVYRTGRVYLNGRADEDADELKGIREALQVRSALAVPLDVGGERRGVLLAVSLKHDFFSDQDARMAENVSRWVGLVAHRAELVEQIRVSAVEEGRRAGAEELVTVLAHDLRNYLQPLRMRLESIRHRAGAAPPAQLRDVHAALRTVDHLGEMVSDILDVARLDRGLFMFDFQPVDLGALAGETAANLDTPEHPVRLTVQSGEPVVVAGDPARLRQCVENLMANAMQKSPRHAEVEILVQREVLANGEAWARLDVIDQGPGIPAEMLPHLFERFVTGRHREGGLGLGLYLAKRIAAAHGGDLAAHSEPGRGARFTVKLPARAPASLAPAAGSVSAPPAAREASPRE